MRLKGIFLVSILCCTLSLARADDASKMAKVQEFFKVARLDQTSAQIMKQALAMTSPAMIERLTGVKLPPGQQQAFGEFQGKVQVIVFRALSWDQLEPEYAKLYAGAFTEEQLDDLIAFYKSPTGQATLDKLPVLMKQSSEMAQQRMIAVMPQIQQLAKDYCAAQQKAKAQQAKPNQQ